jgi:hypothetical protein
MTLSDNYDILITLLLPDIYADWNIESSSEIVENWMSEKSHVANFTLSSQIIYHPDAMKIKPKINKDKFDPDSEISFSWSNSDLSNFINSIETHLQSNKNPNSKMIQLVVYLPPKSSAPLFFRNNNKSEFKILSFLICNTVRPL